jgi:HD-like signal output (HDOD) protein
VTLVPPSSIAPSTPPPSRELAGNLKEKAIRHIGKLPPFTPVLSKLLATLADEGASFGEIGALIEKDTVLAGNVLRLVNSALYGRRGTVNSVRHAVSLLGLNKVRNAAMSMSLAQMYGKLNIHKQWVHRQFNLRGVAEALLADQLAQLMHVEYPEGAFASGLLHHLGMLLSAIALPEEFDRMRNLYLQGVLDLEDCENEAWGFPHQALSAEILREWNLPAPIQRGVRTDLPPNPNATPTLAVVLDSASRIADRLQIPIQPWMRPANGLPAELYADAGLAPQGGKLLEAFHQEFDAIRAFFH